MVANVSLSPQQAKVRDYVLQSDQLSVEFSIDHGWTKVVDDVSLNVPIGTMVGVVGESGSGKTLASLAAIGLLAARGARVTGSVRRRTRDGGADRMQTTGQCLHRPQPDRGARRRSCSPCSTFGDGLRDALAGSGKVKKS